MKGEVPNRREFPKFRIYMDDPGVGDPARNYIPPRIRGNPRPKLYKDSPDVGTNPDSPRINAVELANERAKNSPNEYHISLFQPGDIIEMKEQNFENPDEDRRISFLVIKPAFRKVNAPDPEDFEKMQVKVLEGSNLLQIDSEYADLSYPMKVVGSLVSASMLRPGFISIGNAIELAIKPPGKHPFILATDPITEIIVKRKKGDTYQKVPLAKLSEFKPKETNKNFSRMQNIYKNILNLVNGEISEKISNLDNDRYYRQNNKLRVWNNGNVITFRVNREKGEAYFPIRIFDVKNQSAYDIKKVNGVHDGEEIYHVKVYEGGITPYTGEYGEPFRDAQQTYYYIVCNGEDNEAVQYVMTKAQLKTLDLSERYGLPSQFRIGPEGNISEIGEHKPNKEEEEAKLAQIKTNIEGDKFIIKYGKNESFITFPPNLSALEAAIKLK